MTAVAADATPDLDAAQRLGFEYVSLSELLRRADVVSLHVPGGPETRDMISDREFAQMKPGAVLINTARGGVVNAAALLRALNDGRLLGAGLDVLAEEPLLREEAEIFRPGAPLSPDRLRELVAENALIRLRNVVVTPHIAYDTQEALRRILATTLDNIEAFASSAPTNLVRRPGAAPSKLDMG
jgi:D-lactate dehydrogenase